MGKLINFKSAKGLEVKNKSETRAEITIYGDIGSSFWDESISASDFDRELKSLDKTVNQIDVRLNSPGGDVFDGVTIYNRLKSHKANVTVYIDGLAASIASVIALAGDEIVMGESALLMIHKPWTVAAGNSKELMDVIDRLDIVEDQILSIYKKRTKISDTEIRQMVADETWLDAEQALEMGFVDRVMDSEEKVDIAAGLNKAKWINKKPKVQTKADIAKAKLDDFLARRVRSDK